MKSGRQQVGPDAVYRAITDATDKLCERLRQKGSGTFASRHELLGIMAEEMHELVRAIHEEKADLSGVRRELLDIAVTALFGIACVDSDAMAW
jgi:DNA-binding ferritin-like protein